MPVFSSRTRSLLRPLVSGAAIVLLAVGVLAAGADAAEAPPAEDAGAARAAAPASPLPQAAAPDHDLERGPRGDGARFREWTAIGEPELETVHSAFRHWVELIRSGLADKRVMRLYHFFRHRLEPLDRPVPEGWRERGLAVLRDEARTREAAARFEARRRSADGEGPRRGDLALPPPGAIERADEVLRGERPATDDASAGISAYGVWKPVGPFNIPGRMTGLTRPRGQPDTLYAVAADGGVWRTRDAGATWETLTDFEETLSGGSILLDPTNPDVIYFGTGEGNGAIDNYPGVGVLKSTDGGKTWTKSNAFSSTVRALSMHRDLPNRIFATGDNGCYASSDAGASFGLLPVLPGGGASDVIVRPDEPDTLFCAIWGDGVYRSTNGGAGWTKLTAGFPAAPGRIHLAIHRRDPDVMVAAVEAGSGTLYRSTNGGDTWVQLTGAYQGFCGGQCWYDIAAGIDPVNPDVIYAAGVGSYRTLDGGATWSPMGGGGNHGTPNYVHVDQHDVFTPKAGEVFLANDGGVYRSTDHGATWVEWSQGMDTTQFYGVCRHSNDAYWAFGGTQDNGSERRRQTDAPPWTQVLGADGGMCMSGPPGSNVVLGEFQNTYLLRTADDGASWVNANGGVDGSEPHPWVGVMVADPTNRSNMYVGTSSVYRSLDARATDWVKIQNRAFFNRPVSTLAPAPSDSNVLYVGFELGGLYRTSNALAPTPAWTDVRNPSWPIRTIRRVQVHPDTASTLYTVHAGYGAGKIWKSTNNGGTWVDHTGDLANVPVNDLVIDADNPGTLVAATDLGVFRSDDDGATWYGFSTGLPTVASIELTYDRVSGTLRVGTHGRSMWEWQEAAETAVAVPDGATVAGAPLRVEKLGVSQMRLRWDVQACTARDYNLFHGDLDAIATLIYDGADCGLGTSGLADVALPSTASGSAFFILAATDGQGTDGPHGYDGEGQVRAASGVGFCGLVTQDLSATCP